MIIAVAYENGQVFQHFGHTDKFKFYQIENGKIIFSEVVSTFGTGHSALATFLLDSSADVVICGGIGLGAKNTLANAGIKLYGGVKGSADAAVGAFLAGILDYNPDVQCNHHSKGNGEHTCGSHGCGGHCGK